MTQLNINDKVTQVAGDVSDRGNTGTIVEIDAVAGRARVMWDPPKSKRTWMQFKALQKSASGTSFKGMITIDYDMLVRCFGDPDGPSKDKKAKAQWVVQLPDCIATIYDYKNQSDPTKTTLWHVGGNDLLALHELLTVIAIEAGWCANCGHPLPACEARERCVNHAELNHV